MITGKPMARSLKHAWSKRAIENLGSRIKTRVLNIIKGSRPGRPTRSSKFGSKMSNLYLKVAFNELCIHKLLYPLRESIV
jgi:hypothetical protein